MLAPGVRGDVPATAAADVPLEQHLQNTFPEMAEPVIRPNALLLPSKRGPSRVIKGYLWVVRSYPELVKRNVKARLHCLKKSEQVARHRGALWAGAFAVKKDAKEDRVITNQACKLPRPRFAHIPHTRALSVPQCGVPVSKHDTLSPPSQNWEALAKVAVQTAGAEDREFRPNSSIFMPLAPLSEHRQVGRGG